MKNDAREKDVNARAAIYFQIFIINSCKHLKICGYVQICPARSLQPAGTQGRNTLKPDYAGETQGNREPSNFILSFSQQHQNQSLNVPNFTANLNCSCLSIDLRYTETNAGTLNKILTGILTRTTVHRSKLLKNKEELIDKQTNS